MQQMSDMLWTLALFYHIIGARTYLKGLSFPNGIAENVLPKIVMNYELITILLYQPIPVFAIDTDFRVYL